jgi:hypothetical protein
MQTVVARLLQPTSLVVGLLLAVSLLVALALLVWAGGTHDPELRVGPFRWEPSKHIG